MPTCDAIDCPYPATEQLVDSGVDLLVCRLHALPLSLTPAQQRVQDGVDVVRTRIAVREYHEARRRPRR